MTLRENLIPDDQPYGERQATRQAMQQAGIPTETGIQPAAAPAVASVGGTLPAGPGEPLDVFADTAPTRNVLDMPAPVDPLGGLRQIRDTAMNPFVSMVLTRFLGDK